MSQNQIENSSSKSGSVTLEKIIPLEEFYEKKAAYDVFRTNRTDPNVKLPSFISFEVAPLLAYLTTKVSPKNVNIHFGIDKGNNLTVMLTPANTVLNDNCYDQGDVNPIF